MSILIKGMEMPKSCAECFAEQCIGSDFGCGIIGFEDGNTTCFTRERRKDCPLVEAPKWIPVTERLPLLNTPVLATDGIEVDISWMYGVPPRWITNYTAIDEDKLTHWMPLPQTPKE